METHEETTATMVDSASAQLIGTHTELPSSVPLDSEMRDPTLTAATPIPFDQSLPVQPVQLNFALVPTVRANLQPDADSGSNAEFPGGSNGAVTTRLIPTFLRRRFNRLRMGFFRHSPFPSSDIYRTLPVREEILKALLNCDLVGFSKAYVNVRKEKAIPGFELSISLSFETYTPCDSNGKEGGSAQLLSITGSVEVPYLADENAGEDPELKIVIRDGDGDGPIGRMIKDAFIAKGKPVILDKIRSYVQAVSKGGPAKNELELRKAPLASEKPQLATAVAGNPATGVPTSQLAAGNAGMKENSEKEGFKTITMTERFSCRARDVYEMLMDVNRWKGFTHSNTRITKEIGGQFSLIGGSITWVNEQLQKGKLIMQKFDKLPAEISTALHLLESAKQEQQHELYKACEAGSLPRNDLIGRGNDKEFVMQWLRNPSNDHPGTDLYRNISLLAIVGHGGMEKRTLLQYVYKDEMTEEFLLKPWVCVFNNYDMNKIIEDMLKSLKMSRPPLDTLYTFHKNLKSEIISKGFLLVLDDLWNEEEEWDKAKWENVLASLSCGIWGRDWFCAENSYSPTNWQTEMLVHFKDSKVEPPHLDWGKPLHVEFQGWRLHQILHQKNYPGFRFINQ